MKYFIINFVSGTLSSKMRSLIEAVFTQWLDIHLILLKQEFKSHIINKECWRLVFIL